LGEKRTVDYRTTSELNQSPMKAVGSAMGLLRLFDAAVKAAPDAIALGFGSESVTYGELDEKTDRLALKLIQLGLGPELVAGLYASRGPGFIVGALGILKSGGAYLPIDPSFPLDHCRYLLGDAGVSLVVTERALASSGLFSSDTLPVVEIDSSSLDHIGALPFPEQLIKSKLLDAEPRSLAYVIYTSGSTGKPKGVEITHRGFSNLIDWHQDAFEIKPSDRATQFSSLSFDAAVWEIWPYLAAGSSVHFVPDEVRVDPQALRDWLVMNRITVSFIPTPLAESLIALEWPSHTALRKLLTGADTLHRYPARGLPFQLINNYGPTECTVVATSGIISPDDEKAELPSIGRPIANTQVYVLNDDLRHVSAGEAGEVFIGGEGVARGYRNRPDLTAKRFVMNPFGENPEDRLYRTGDLARFLPDGQIGFLGREDEQIKISGYRIEPEQIVQAMVAHPSVDAAAVVARQDANSAKKLVAYIVPKRGCELTSSVLRGFLERRLPSYMVPVIFVRLGSLPITANGKTDRAALPEPSSSNVLQEPVVADAKSPVEERLARILGRLLGLDAVGTRDNFFNLGGHSLMATQLIARIRDEFGVNLGLRIIFDSPTVAALSTKIEEAIFAKIEAMTEEEAQSLLSQLMTQPRLETSTS
jgi:amino acid adenylation domain-containing protein